MALANHEEQTEKQVIERFTLKLEGEKKLLSQQITQLNPTVEAQNTRLKEKTLLEQSLTAVSQNQKEQQLIITETERTKKSCDAKIASFTKQLSRAENKKSDLVDQLNQLKSPNELTKNRQQREAIKIEIERMKEALKNANHELDQAIQKQLSATQKVSENINSLKESAQKLASQEQEIKANQRAFKAAQEKLDLFNLQLKKVESELAILSAMDTKAALSSEEKLTPFWKDEEAVTKFCGKNNCTINKTDDGCEIHSNKLPDLVVSVQSNGVISCNKKLSELNEENLATTFELMTNAYVNTIDNDTTRFIKEKGLENLFARMFAALYKQEGSLPLFTENPTINDRSVSAKPSISIESTQQEPADSKELKQQSVSTSKSRGTIIKNPMKEKAVSSSEPSISTESTQQELTETFQKPTMRR